MTSNRATSPVSPDATDTDAEANTAKITHTKKFPIPQYLLQISAKNVVLVDREDVGARVDPHMSIVMNQLWNQNLVAHLTEEIKKKKKIRVKIGSLLVKMVNRLIREEVVPVEAITVVTSESFITIRCLIAPSALPVIMLRCERIGVGNVTGKVWAVPLETSLMPPSSGKKEIDMIYISGQEEAPDIVDNAERNTKASVDQTANTTTTTTIAKLTTTESEEADEEISSSDDNEEPDEDESRSIPTCISVPFLSAERKKKLTDAIIKARQEWKDTSSRVRVLQVVEEVNAAASFTFDYAFLVACAAWIAGMGLGSNSGPTVIASMLVSPIMGPVMGFTFGTTVRNKELVIKGIKNELVSLLICMIIGSFLSIIATVTLTPGKRDWPSDEMTSRGDILGLTSGVLIAIPSGIATALSTLGKNSSGMVGVAISLSLLPPAVNAAMCWTYELMLMSNKYSRNEGDTTNYWELGTISFALTMINIVCIWLSGVFTFWLKEVAPIDQKNAFWSDDLAEYRKHKRKDTDLNVINDGIKAAAELQNAVAMDKKEDLYVTEQTIDFTDRRAGEHRRRGLADNALEDALYLDTKTLGAPDIVPGGAINLNEAKLQDVADDTVLKDELLTNANKFGTLTDAGKALFDTNLIDSELVSSDESFPSNDVGIRHGAVAEEVLLNGLSSGYN